MRTLLLSASLALIALPAPAQDHPSTPSIETRLAKYTSVKLTTDLSVLTPKERQMIPILIDAAKLMDDIYWVEAYGNRDSLLASLPDADYRRFARINYGPWDRLDANVPFVPGVGPKPAGANFYPRNMTRPEFEAAAAGNPALKSLYTLVRRDAQGRLQAVPYYLAFADQVKRAAGLLRRAAALAEDPGLRRYLELRADALLTDQYQPSDLAWMDMKNNTVDVVIGPIETYEDELFNYKAAHEAFVLVKDREWSARLSRYISILPELQRGLPVPDAYKQETPGTDSDLNAYDAIYYAGESNAGSKTIAINLPNDEEVQTTKGTRRLQLKNAMRAKFDSILVPLADSLIAPEQQRYIGFDAFFANVMFHEVAHGLGIKHTIDGRGTVRQALKEQSGWLEEAKADVLGLYMITKLIEGGEAGDIRNNYVTFLASIFRSIRFGAGDAHGRANAAEFGFLMRQGAFDRDPATGRYRVNFEKMGSAVDALSAAILKLQGDGDYEGTRAFLAEMGTLDDTLKSDLARLARAGIPVDVVFEQ